MMRFVFLPLLFLFSLLLAVHGQVSNNDTQFFNITPVSLDAVGKHREPSLVIDPNQRSLADGTVNTNIFTVFIYNGSQIYVYSSFANENENKLYPQRWIFYYVPVMAPIQTSTNDVWVWSMKNEIRVKLMLGDREVEHMARDAVSKKYDMKIAEYSKYWDIVPLMIDSLTAYVVTGSNSPVVGVKPYRSIHPNSLVMIFRFSCSTDDNAQTVAKMIGSGEYEIEVAFYFAGFKHTSSSSVSITAEQLKSVSSKTTADGGNTNAKYIHRNQASKFIGEYVTNVKKMIYSDSSNANTQSLATGLEDQFISLFQQGK
jgi:hypothetical protein